MPVVFNEPLSFVQRVVEYMEYATLLQKACECNDPVQRMEVCMGKRMGRGRRDGMDGAE